MKGLRNFTYEFIHPQIFFVKSFFAFALIFFTRTRATIFFEAREIFSLSPLREKIVTAFSSLSIPMFGIAQIICHHHVAILCSKFRASMFFHVICFRGETDHEEISRWWKRFQNVACRNELERKSFVTLFDFLFGHARRFVIGDRGAHHQHVAIEHRLDGPQLHISSLVTTLTSLAPAGGVRFTGPEIRRTW